MKKLILINFIWRKFAANYNLTGKKTDYIVVGAGLAGVSLALELISRGKRVVLFDCHAPSDSSRVAAGIIHPIVPKGVRSTWMGKTIFPMINQWYEKWENQLESTFYQPLSGYQIHPNEDTGLFWQKRSGSPEIHQWLLPLRHETLTGIKSPCGYTPILQCARLNTLAFLDSALAWLRHQIDVRNEEFKYEYLKEKAGKWQYCGETALGVVFCEGIRAIENPWFRHLHFHPTGGDILTVSFQEALPQALYKNRTWLVPDGTGNWLAGSTFHKGSLETTPNHEDAESLIKQLKSWTSIPFELIHHRRGIRPTVEGRRPYLGEHHSDKGIYIYNGLGSKGSSLIPWLSPMMADFICHGQKLHPETDINRFVL
jgi:glycine/D-amino acid oxidase-like deaminating enzyme